MEKNQAVLSVDKPQV